MSEDASALVVDTNSKPAPQFYDDSSSEFDYLHGEQNAAWSVLLPPNGSIVTKATSVAKTAIQVDSGTAKRRAVKITNRGTVDVFLGGTTAVTTANGWPLAVGATEVLALGPGVALYAIGSTTTDQDVRCLEVCS